jgi:hypothetical protein
MVHWAKPGFVDFYSNGNNMGKVTHSEENNM